jgi:hypothetical protein
LQQGGAPSCWKFQHVQAWGTLHDRFLARKGLITLSCDQPRRIFLYLNPATVSTHNSTDMTNRLIWKTHRCETPSGHLSHQ